MSLTIGENIAELQHSLREYIDETYHISHPALVLQRRDTTAPADTSAGGS